MKRKYLSIVALVSMIFLVVSCSVKNDDNVSTDAAFFLVANVSADAPPLSVYINSSSFATNFSYGSRTLYWRATPGSYKFDFTSTASTPVLSTTVTMEPKTYSYFVIDSFSKVKAAFVEDNFTSVSGDSVYIRFFNFSPNVGTVNVVDSTSKTLLFSNRSFNDQSTNPSYASFVRMKAGNYTLQLQRSDTTGTILASRKDTLEGGHSYSVFAKGFKDGTGTQELGFGQILNQ